MLRVALLCSRRAPGLAHLLEQDPRRGREYEIVVGLTTDPLSEAPGLLRQAGVPAVVHDLRAFYEARGVRRSDLGVRRAFDAETRDQLAPFRPDIVVLSGYVHIVTGPLLTAYPHRIINVHDGDLPQYPGLHATRDAMRAGAAATFCTAHLVTADVDAGPVLARSEPFPVGERHHYVQREWMMDTAWGPLIAHAMDLIIGADPGAPPRGQPIKPAAAAVTI